MNTEQKVCNLKNHPDGVDCYGQRILTKYEYNQRGVNTEPVCKLTSHDEIKREAEYRTTYAPILEKSAVHRFIEDLDDRTIYDKEELLGIWAESYLTQSKEGGE